MATDRGLYLLFYTRGEAGARRELRSRRLALSGLTATPMVLAYTSFLLPDGTSREFLWVTDLQGDSHLFWGDASKASEDRSFLGSALAVAERRREGQTRSRRGRRPEVPADRRPACRGPLV